jgi:hypothetical protein
MQKGGRIIDFLMNKHARLILNTSYTHIKKNKKKREGLGDNITYVMFIYAYNCPCGHLQYFQ